MSTLNNKHEFFGGDYTLLRKQKVHAWHNKGSAAKHTFLSATNSGVSTTKKTSGSVVSSSDYIRYKKIGAATRNF